jgi:hypothetical protein
LFFLSDSRAAVFNSLALVFFIGFSFPTAGRRFLMVWPWCFSLVFVFHFERSFSDDVGTVAAGTFSGIIK